MVETTLKPRYNDKYVTLTDTTLILKTYYFPMGSSKTIPLDNIERIWIGTDPEPGLESILQTKSWGMAGSNVCESLLSFYHFFSLKYSYSSFAHYILCSQGGAAEWVGNWMVIMNAILLSR